MNTKEYSTKVTTSDTLTQEINSELYPSSDASYNVYAEILDNAGNITKTDSIQFKIDDIPPTLNVSYDDKVFEKELIEESIAQAAEIAINRLMFPYGLSENVKAQ